MPVFFWITDYNRRTAYHLGLRGSLLSPTPARDGIVYLLCCYILMLLVVYVSKSQTECVRCFIAAFIAIYGTTLVNHTRLMDRVPEFFVFFRINSNISSIGTKRSVASVYP